MTTQDFILNGTPNGPIATALAQNRFDPGMLRPYFDDRGRQCVTVNTGRFETYQDNDGNYRSRPIYEQVTIAELRAQGIDSPVFNATTLRKDQWIELDRAVQMAVMPKLRAWSDLAAANTYSGFNAYGRSILEHERVTEYGEAVVDMDGTSPGTNDGPKYQLEGLPLPITHSDFDLKDRTLEISRNSGAPLDTEGAANAARRVAEMVEKTTIGTVTGLTFGNATLYGNTPTVYGYRNHPDRITKTDITAPTAVGWTPKTLVDEVLVMRQLAYAQNFTGPFMLYHSDDWDNYMDNDHYISSTGLSGKTLRQRLEGIDGINGCRRLDWFTNDYELLLVQMTSNVCRAVNGMDLRTVQWDERGGMLKKFMVMCIWVPQVRSTYVGQTTTEKTGIVHGTTS